MVQLLLKPEDAARALGISRSKLYVLLAENRVPSITIGVSRRIPAEALRRWVDEKLAEQSAEAGAAR